MYTSNLKEVDKSEIQKLFNSYQNKDGNVCILILLSSIAETGLSLFCVNYFYLLDYIPGLSQYKQITSRAVRLYSHKMIPERNYVQIYNLM